jgi:hypothetical protein
VRDLPSRTSRSTAVGKTIFSGVAAVTTNRICNGYNGTETFQLQPLD